MIEISCVFGGAGTIHFLASFTSFFYLKFKQTNKRILFGKDPVFA